MSVDLESRIYATEQTVRVGRLENLGGVPTYRLPINTQEISFHTQQPPSSDPLMGDSALAADILLNPRNGGIVSIPGLGALLGVGQRRAKALVREVADEARYAGVTITRDSSHGGVYIVGLNELHHRKSVKRVGRDSHNAGIPRHTLGISRGAIESASADVVWGTRKVRVSKPNSTRLVTHGTRGASAQRRVRRWR